MKADKQDGGAQTRKSALIASLTPLPSALVQVYARAGHALLPAGHVFAQSPWCRKAKAHMGTKCCTGDRTSPCCGGSRPSCHV